MTCLRELVDVVASVSCCYHFKLAAHFGDMTVS